MGTSKIVPIDEFFSLYVGDEIGLVSHASGSLSAPTIDAASVTRVEVGERPHPRSVSQSRFRDCIEVVLRLFTHDGTLGAEIPVGTLDPTGSTRPFIDMSMYRPIYADSAELHSTAEALACEIRAALPGSGNMG